jgi:UDP-glucuronate decarboxylase
MRILVTGGAGFLGSHLCDSILNLGHQVISADNFYTGSLENLDHLLSNLSFKSIRHDVTEPIDLEIDGIFNLASPASPVHYQRNPIETLKTNVLGAMNVLNLAKQNGIRILQASTSEIYGDPKIHPQNEEYWGYVNPIGLRACYDEGKRAAETLFFDYHRQYGLDIRVARIFNTYGPRMSFHDGRVVSNFIFQALKGLPITIYGDGQQRRSFCYVEDMVAGIIKLFFTENIHEPINLGNPTPISIANLAKEIISITNSKSEIVFRELPNDDPKDREPDISKARSILSWNPHVPREEGLKKTIKDIQEKLIKASNV